MVVLLVGEMLWTTGPRTAPAAQKHRRRERSPTARRCSAPWVIPGEVLRNADQRRRAKGPELRGERHGSAAGGVQTEACQHRRDLSAVLRITRSSTLAEYRLPHGLRQLRLAAEKPGKGMGMQFSATSCGADACLGFLEPCERSPSAVFGLLHRKYWSRMNLSLTAPTDVFTAIAHPARRQILDALCTGEQPVHALAAPFSMSRPAVSQHLKLLRQAGLVSEVRHGRERRYALQPERLRDVSSWLAHYEPFWTTMRAAESERHHRGTSSAAAARAANAKSRTRMASH
jgi:DNA-binding transcriptional ArsR family regulator